MNKQTAVQLIVVGWMLILTPFMIGGFDQDSMENLISRLPLNKLVLIRSLMLSGMGLILTGCFFWAK